MTKTRTFLVLGGTGFVGSHLVPALVAAGHRVRVPSRHPERAPALRVLPGVELVRADVHDPVELAACAAGCDILVNLVGILNESGRSGAGFRRAHVELATKTVGACRSAGVPRLLHMSGLPASPDGPSHYLRTKGEAEGVVGAAADLAVTIFRPSVIFGRGDSFLNRFATLLGPLPALPLARIEARLQPVFVGDVVEAFCRAAADSLTHGRSYDLVGPEVMTLGQIVRYVRDQLGLNRAVFGLPDALGALQAGVLEWLPGKPLSLDNFRSLGVPSTSDRDGLGELGIKPTPLAAIAPAYLGADARTARLMRNRSGLSTRNL